MIQHYMIKFVSDFKNITGSLILLTLYDKGGWLKVVLNTIPNPFDNM